MTDPIREAAEEVVYEATVGPPMTLVERIGLAIARLKISLDQHPPKGVCTGCQHFYHEYAATPPACGWWYEFPDGLDPAKHSCAEWKARDATE